MDYSILLAQAALNGLVIGAMYTLMAVGFTLTFGIMRVVNFAHGEFYMLGAFTGFFTYVNWNIPFVVCLLIAAALLYTFRPNVPCIRMNETRLASSR